MMTVLIIAGGIWATASQAGLLENNKTLVYKAMVILQLILVVLAFIFSMVMFGCIVEYQGREPGIITIGFSYIPPILYLYAIGLFSRLVYLFLVVSVFVILYFLFSE